MNRTDGIMCLNRLPLPSGKNHEIKVKPAIIKPASENKLPVCKAASEVFSIEVRSGCPCSTAFTLIINANE